MLQAYFLLPILCGALLLTAFFVRHRRDQQRAKRKAAAADSSLWNGLAAGLFDAAGSSPETRLEISLAALSQRFRMEAGVLVVARGGRFEVLAMGGSSTEILNTLSLGRELDGRNYYFGSVTGGDSLAISYASLSEWRRHPACSEGGWEAFLGQDCGFFRDGRLIAGFLARKPRDQIFSPSEERILAQLAPWMMALASEIQSERFDILRLGPTHLSGWEARG